MIHIVGSGWYGCHLIEKLIHNKFDYICWEQNESVLSGSSSKNQNRLHLGYHYPRNSITRKQSKEGFEMFLESYPSLSREISRNIYSIPNDSFIDFDSYKAIYHHEQYLFTELIDTHSLSNIEGAIEVSERLILHESASNFWNSKDFNINFNVKVSIVNGKLLSDSGKRICKNSDIVIDCTYGDLLFDEDCFSEFFLTFLVRIDNFNFGAITFMDGPFFSIFPLENSTKENLYTLTHVSFCVLKSKNIDLKTIKEIFSHVLTDCSHYLGDYIKNIDLHSWYISRKRKPISNSDSRSVNIKQYDNIISVQSGKIDAVFHAEKLVSQALDNILKK
jgi:hypothetical protein